MKSRQEQVRSDVGNDRVWNSLYDQMMCCSSTSGSPWYILPAWVHLCYLWISVPPVALFLSDIPESPYTICRSVLCQAEWWWWWGTEFPTTPVGDRGSLQSCPSLPVAIGLSNWASKFRCRFRGFCLTIHIFQSSWMVRHHGSPKWHFWIQLIINSSSLPVAWDISPLYSSAFNLWPLRLKCWWPLQIVVFCQYIP